MGKVIERQVIRRVGRIRPATLEWSVGGADREYETGAKGMRVAEQAARVHLFADAFDADPEVASHGRTLQRCWRQGKVFRPRL